MDIVRALSSEPVAGNATGHQPDAAHAAGFNVDPTDGGLFVFVALVIGAVVRGINKFIPIPYTVLLLLLGGAIGAIDASTNLGALSDSIHAWLVIDPHLLFHIFLPALIFGSAFSVDPHVFLWEITQMTVLATLGVAVATGLTASFTFCCMGPGLAGHWATGLAFGAMLSATDPVAVVALLKELGAPKQLSLLIEGESLFNDGTAMAVFLVFLELMKGVEMSGGEMILFFVQLSLGGVGLGLAFGLVIAFWMGSAKWDAMTQITITFFGCYVTFIIAEGALHVSGVLAVVTLGLVLAVSGRTSIKDHESMHHFWEMIEYIANTLVFVLAGVIIVERGFLDEVSTIGLTDFGHLLVNYAILNVVRFVTVYAMWPILGCCTRWRGYALGWREVTVISWSGLRGAVGLVLSLLVAESALDAPGLEDAHRTGRLFLFHMAGITVLTLLLNGSTTGVLVKYFGIGATSAPVAHMFSQAVKALRGAYEGKKRKLKADEFFRNTDWTLVSGKVDEVFAELHEQSREAHRNAVAPGTEKDVSVRGFFAFACAACQGGVARRRRKGTHEWYRCVSRVRQFSAAMTDLCLAPLSRCCGCCARDVRPDAEEQWSCCAGWFGPRCPCPCCGLCCDDELVDEDAVGFAETATTPPEAGKAAAPLKRGVSERVVASGRDVPNMLDLAIAQDDAGAGAGAGAGAEEAGGRAAPKRTASHATGSSPPHRPVAAASPPRPPAAVSATTGPTLAGKAPGRPSPLTLAARAREDGSDSDSEAQQEAAFRTPRVEGGEFAEGGGAAAAAARGSSSSSDDSDDGANGTDAIPAETLASARRAAASRLHPPTGAAGSSTVRRGVGRSRPAGIRIHDPEAHTQARPPVGPTPKANLVSRKTFKAAVRRDQSAHKASRNKPHHTTTRGRAVLAASRQRYLSIIKRRYLAYYEKGRIGSRAYEMLSEASAKCLDDVAQRLHEWDVIRTELQNDRVRRLVWAAKCDDAVFKKVEFEYELCAGFIHAHTNVITFLRMVVSDVSAIDQLALEEHEMVTAAREYLEDALQEHSVTRAVQTRQAIRVLLTAVEKHARYLHVHGEIDEKEHHKIVEAVHKGWDDSTVATKLEVDDVQQLKEAAFFDALPAHVIDELVHSAKSKIKEYASGAVMMKENEHANGVVIIVAGLAELRQRPPSASASTSFVSAFPSAATGVDSPMASPDDDSSPTTKATEATAAGALEAGSANLPGQGRSSSAASAVAGGRGHHGGKTRHNSLDGLAPGELHLGSDGGSEAGDIAMGPGASHRVADAIVVDRRSSFAHQREASRIAVVGGRSRFGGSEANMLGLIRAATANKHEQVAAAQQRAARAWWQRGEGGSSGSSEGVGSTSWRQRRRMERQRRGAARAAGRHGPGWLGGGEHDNATPPYYLDAHLRPITADGQPVDREAVFGRVIDTLSWGSVIGALSMLTGFRTQVTAIARTRVRAVILRQADIYSLLKSAPVPGLPFRRVKPLETALCKMAGVLVTELNKVRGFESLSPSDVREVMAASRLLRPEALTAVKIFGDILVLTGRVLKPKDKQKALYIATHLASYKRGRVFGITRSSARRKSKSGHHKGHSHGDEDEQKPHGADQAIRRRAGKESTPAGEGDEDDGAGVGPAAKGAQDRSKAAVPRARRSSEGEDGVELTEVRVTTAGSENASAAEEDGADDDGEQEPEAFDTNAVDADEMRAAQSKTLANYRAVCEDGSVCEKPPVPGLVGGAGVAGERAYRARRGIDATAVSPTSSSASSSAISKDADLLDPDTVEAELASKPRVHRHRPSEEVEEEDERVKATAAADAAATARQSAEPSAAASVGAPPRLRREHVRSATELLPTTRPMSAASSTAHEIVADGEQANSEVDFDPQYARKQREQQRRAKPRTFTVNGERLTLSSDDFFTVSSTFTFLPHNPYIFRWFGEGTRLLCIPHGLLKAKRQLVEEEAKELKRAQASKSLHARLAHMPESERNRMVSIIQPKHGIGSRNASAVGGAAASLADVAAQKAFHRRRTFALAAEEVDAQSERKHNPLDMDKDKAKAKAKGKERRGGSRLAKENTGFYPPSVPDRTKQAAGIGASRHKASATNPGPRTGSLLASPASVAAGASPPPPRADDHVGIALDTPTTAGESHDFVGFDDAPSRASWRDSPAPDGSDTSANMPRTASELDVIVAGRGDSMMWAADPRIIGLSVGTPTPAQPARLPTSAGPSAVAAGAPARKNLLRKAVSMLWKPTPTKETAASDQPAPPSAPAPGETELAARVHRPQPRASGPRARPAQARPPVHAQASHGPDTKDAARVTTASTLPSPVGNPPGIDAPRSASDLHDHAAVSGWRPSPGSHPALDARGSGGDNAFSPARLHGRLRRMDGDWHDPHAHGMHANEEGHMIAQHSDFDLHHAVSTPTPEGGHSPVGVAWHGHDGHMHVSDDFHDGTYEVHRHMDHHTHAGIDTDASTSGSASTHGRAPAEPDDHSDSSTPDLAHRQTSQSTPVGPEGLDVTALSEQPSEQSLASPTNPDDLKDDDDSTGGSASRVFS